MGTFNWGGSKPKENIEQAAREKLINGSRQLQSIEVAYNAQLIEELKGEHTRLLSNITEIETLYNKKKFSKCREKIRHLINDYFMHSAKEQANVYSFLEKEVRGSARFTQFMKSFRKGSGEVNSELNRFYSKRDMCNSSKTATEFNAALSSLKSSLNQRFQTEEKLVFEWYQNYEDFARTPDKYLPNEQQDNSVRFNAEPSDLMVELPVGENEIELMVS